MRTDSRQLCLDLIVLEGEWFFSDVTVSIREEMNSFFFFVIYFNIIYLLSSYTRGPI